MVHAIVISHCLPKHQRLAKKPYGISLCPDFDVILTKEACPSAGSFEVYRLCSFPWTNLPQIPASPFYHPIDTAQQLKANFTTAKTHVLGPSRPSGNRPQKAQAMAQARLQWYDISKYWRERRVPPLEGLPVERLFWYRKSPPPRESSEWLKTVLEEGDREDLRNITQKDLQALDVTKLGRRIQSLWTGFLRREADKKLNVDKVITEKHREILRLAAKIFAPNGFVFIPNWPR